MTSWQRYLAYFWPQTAASVISPINGRILINYYWGSYRLVAGGLTQSGGLVAELWQTALKHLTPSPKSALILGFGAGSAAHCLKRQFPGVQITGIELDPIMVELGKKYLYPGIFTPGVKVIIADAFTWLLANHTQYDLIVVDLYLGNNFPQKIFTHTFIEQVKHSLTSSGKALFNIFALTKHESNANKMIGLLNRHFSTVTRLHTISNWIYLVLK
jgi:spermidine synthase